MAQKTGVKVYINDSLLLIFLCAIMYIAYDSLCLKEWIYLLIVFALSLHNMGVFGFYNISPIPLQWDHVTHLVGLFAVGIFAYNFAYASGFFKNILIKTNKLRRFNVIIFIILAALGLGVFVEFIEFIGYFVVGDGLGVFGHGTGDIVTEFIDSEWFNTVFDLIYNFMGAVLGVIFCRYILRNKFLRKPV